MYRRESEVLYELIFVTLEWFRISMHDHLLILTHITLTHDSIVSVQLHRSSRDTTIINNASRYSLVSDSENCSTYHSVWFVPSSGVFYCCLAHLYSSYHIRDLLPSGQAVRNLVCDGTAVQKFESSNAYKTVRQFGTRKRFYFPNFTNDGLFSYIGKFHSLRSAFSNCQKT